MEQGVEEDLGFYGVAGDARSMLDAEELDGGCTSEEQLVEAGTGSQTSALSCSSNLDQISCCTHYLPPNERNDITVVTDSCMKALNLPFIVTNND